MEPCSFGLSKVFSTSGRAAVAGSVVVQQLQLLRRTEKDLDTVDGSEIPNNHLRCKQTP